MTKPKHPWQHYHVKVFDIYIFSFR